MNEHDLYRDLGLPPWTYPWGDRSGSEALGIWHHRCGCRSVLVRDGETWPLQKGTPNWGPRSHIHVWYKVELNTMRLEQAVLAKMKGINPYNLQLPHLYGFLIQPNKHKYSRMNSHMPTRCDLTRSPRAITPTDLEISFWNQNWTIPRRKVIYHLNFEEMIEYCDLLIQHIDTKCIYIQYTGYMYTWYTCILCIPRWFYCCIHAAFEKQRISPSSVCFELRMWSVCIAPLPSWDREWRSSKTRPGVFRRNGILILEA